MTKVKPRFKNWGCPSFLQGHTNVQLRQSKGVKGREIGRGGPLPSRLGDLGEHRKLPQRGLGRSPSRKRFWGVSCTILRDFTHRLVHLIAAWKWEIPTSLYWLVGVMFPFDFFWGVGHPNLNFGGVWTATTPTVAAPLTSL